MRRWIIVLVPASIVALVGLVGLLYALGDASARRDLVSTLLNPAIMTPSIVCGVIMPWLSARQARMRNIRSVMLAHKRCPHCGYNLLGLPVEPDDGATVCPECGAAWRLDDVAGIPSRAEDASRRTKALLLTGVLLGLTLAAGLGAYLLF